MIAPFLLRLALLCLLGGGFVAAEDWPRWRGPRGDGTLLGDTLPKKFPEGGLSPVWRQKIGGGYSGVTVANGKVYIMDRDKPRNAERVSCFRADNGEAVWEHRYAVSYQGLDYDNGPRASVTIHEGRAYSLGAVGHLFCFEADTGKILWSRDTVKDLGAKFSGWGFSSSPVIHEDKVICHLGIPADGCYVAFDRLTGNEVWRSGKDQAGYCTPALIRHQEAEQLICWTPQHIHGLRPASGEILWSIPFKVTYGVSIATPIFHDGVVLINEYWHGSKAISLDGTKAKVLWESNELCGLMSQALHRDGFVYMLDKDKGLCCYEWKTGKLRWKDDKHKLTPQDKHPQLSMVRSLDSAQAMILNSNGELISLRLTPERWEELDRAPLIDKTWADPAYANGYIFARSDRQLVCAKLGAN